MDGGIRRIQGLGRKRTASWKERENTGTRVPFFCIYLGLVDGSASRFTSRSEGGRDPGVVVK